MGTSRPTRTRSTRCAAGPRRRRLPTRSRARSWRPTRSGSTPSRLTTHRELNMAKFLVTGEFIEVGVLVPPDQFLPIMEGLIIPSLEQLARWESEGRLAGGIVAGERAGAFILEAAS